MSMLSNKMSTMSPHSWKSFSYHIWISLSIYTLFWTERFGFDPAVEETEWAGLYGVGLAARALLIWLAVPIVLYFTFVLSPRRALLICSFAHSCIWLFTVFLLLNWCGTLLHFLLPVSVARTLFCGGRTLSFSPVTDVVPFFFSLFLFLISAPGRRRSRRLSFDGLWCSWRPGRTPAPPPPPFPKRQNNHFLKSATEMKNSSNYKVWLLYFFNGLVP